jgi:hypothetical protein
LEFIKKSFKSFFRTTNCFEGVHCALQAVLKAFPDIGLFGGELQKEQLFNKKNSICFV